MVVVVRAGFQLVGTLPLGETVFFPSVVYRVHVRAALAPDMKTVVANAASS
jgi:hypothetical protein